MRSSSSTRFLPLIGLMALTLGVSACSASPDEDANADPSNTAPAVDLAYADGGAEEAGDETPQADDEIQSSGTVEEIDDQDVVVFVAAVERMLADGPYEGAIHESPDVYAAMAQQLCFRLDDGDSINSVVTETMDQAGLEMNSGEDRTLIGSVLGAGVESFCPRHRDLL